MAMGDRLRFALALLALWLGSFAAAAPGPGPPLGAFPGRQLRRMQAPTLTTVEDPGEIIVPSPTVSPAGSTETVVVVPVNVFLTGVPDGVNMTDDEQQTFETILFDLLESRLDIVSIDVKGVEIASQINDPDFSAEFFSSRGGGGGVETADGEGEPVLQLVTDVTIAYSPPPPDEVRDWSIYIKSWIESFGVTIIEIFTNSQHPQHPQTSSKFWDDLIDVSATNVNPPNTDPTGSPTPYPTLIVVPEKFDNPRNVSIVAGVSAAAGLALCCCGVYVWIRLRRRVPPHGAESPDDDDGGGRVPPPPT